MSPSLVSRPRADSIDTNPFDTASVYYGIERQASRHPRNRAFSDIFDNSRNEAFSKLKAPARRASVDELSKEPWKFWLPVERTLKELLEREDTDNNMQITIDDTGSKVFHVGTAASSGFRKVEIRGNYAISNLLQELTLAQGLGRVAVVMDEYRLNENPVNRLSRFIKTVFWDNLTRRIDGENIEKVALDPKDWTSDPRPRIYIPRGAPEQYAYYCRLSQQRPDIRLDVQWLPAEKITGEYVKNLNNAPGLLAIDMEKCINDLGEEDLKGKPFVVPGGRFNELYGWDSYMESLGLLVSDRIDLAKSMVEHFCFCIEHYGKIFNANRSYYLGRSQPPFLTDMALRVYDKIHNEEGAKHFLRRAICAAIKEYHGIWMAEPRLDKITGLSRYRPTGKGVPPETESSHFTHILQPYAQRHGITIEQFVEQYNSGKIHEPALDTYFLHDRAVRESGHDTSYRLENTAADLATIDLNSLLYKYEIDISRTIHTWFGDALTIPAEFCAEGFVPGYLEHSSIWDRRARKRRAAIDKYLWNGEKGMYFDYNTMKKEQTDYESATTFWALWAGVASPQQAMSLVKNALPKFEEYGGLVSGTEKSRGVVGLDRPNRQWDYPYGWAPQQMLAWTGLMRYGYHDAAQRLTYKWLYMVTKAFFDFNGVVVEKYDLTRPDDPHKVDAEYGNQGSNFKGVATEGFGWVNASYIYGLTLVNVHMKRALGALINWDTFYRMTRTRFDSEDDGENVMES